MSKKKPMSRSEQMSKIRGKDTGIELLLRKALWHKGYRYRKNCRKLPGTPDICFLSKKLAIFCDSEFWHGKDFLEGRTFKTNSEFWKAKMLRNIERDRSVNKQLQEMGWTVLRFWGKDIIENTQECVKEIEKHLKGEDHAVDKKPDRSNRDT